MDAAWLHLVLASGGAVTRTVRLDKWTQWRLVAGSQWLVSWQYHCALPVPPHGAIENTIEEGGWTGGGEGMSLDAPSVVGTHSARVLPVVDLHSAHSRPHCATQSNLNSPYLSLSWHSLAALTVCQTKLKCQR